MTIVAATVALLPSAHATAKVTTNRYGGSDRYATAAVLAEKAFPGGANGALLARAADFPTGAKGFPDALAANYLAGFGLPVLLTAPDNVPAATLQALNVLKVKNVLILGGTSAVSSVVEAVLHSTGSTNAAGGNLSTARVAGANRYQTASMIAESGGPGSVGTLSGLPTALIARGDDFPDALAAGPLAAADHFPLLLTETASLDPNAAQALQALKIKGALILGGTSAISAATEQSIKALGISTVRLSGAVRQATAAAIADYAITYLKFSDTLADLARGDDYPDALAAGIEADKAGPVPIVLTGSPTVLSSETAAWLASVNGTLAEVDALGGTSAVSDAVLQQAAQAATCTPSPAPTTTGTNPLGGVLTTLLGLLGGGTTTSSLPVPTTTGATLPGSCKPPLTTSTTSGGSTTTVPGATTTQPATTLPGVLPTLPPITLPCIVGINASSCP